jgi:hypothetical protein
MKKSFWFLLVGILFGCRSSTPLIITEGTTAVCFGTINYIVIGADTKSVVLDPVTNKPIYFGRVTKVHQKNNIIYASAGFLKNSFLNIDIIEIINGLTLTGIDLKSNIKQIDQAIYGSLQYSAQVTKEQAPAQFKSKYLDKNLSTFAFGTYENGKPIVGYLNFICKVNSNGKVYLKDSICVHDSMPVIFPIGHGESIDSINHRNPDFYKSYRSPLDLLNDLIRMQARRNPEDVNDTIDIIGINAQGIQMFEKENVKTIIE